MANTKWAGVVIDPPASVSTEQSLIDIFLNFPSGEFESIPIVENSTVYGFKEYPYTTFYNKMSTASGTRRGPQRVYLRTSGGKVRNILTAPNPADYAGLELFFHHLGNDNFDGLSYRTGGGSILGIWENATISGKYKLKIRSSTITSKITIPLKFSYNNKNYDMFYGVGNSIQYFYGYRFLENGWERDIITVEDNIGGIIDFGDVPQDVPTIFLDYLNGVAEPYFPYTYTIKSYDGETVLGEFAEVPPMKRALLSVIGNRKILTITSILDINYSVEWNSETPAGQIFLGLSTTPNSNRPTLLANTESDISWVGNLVFYEAYGTYRPPATVFDINLYQNSAEVNRVDKGQFLVGVGTLSGALREECSMLTPSIVYQSSDVPNFNYVYIPIFNRYYFVTSLSSVSKNVWRMELNCDVLMSYKNEILLLQGVVGRQEIDFNPMLVDSELPTQDNPEVEIVNIPSTAFKSHTNVEGNFYNFVLTVIG